MSDPKILIRSSVIKSLARNRSYTNKSLSDKTGIAIEEIELMMSENSTVPLSIADTIAKKAFDHPWTVFLLDTPEPPLKHGQDHRTVRNREHGMTSKIVRVLQDSAYLLDVANEISPEFTVELPKITKNEQSDPGVMALKMRKYIKAPVEDQFALKDQYEALRYWKDKVQSLGIYIAEKKLPIDDVRAFSLRKENKALIVISTEDYPYPRIFSIFHELCHIMLRNTGICDLHISSNRENIEQFCNAFSASFLVPKDVFKKTLVDSNIKRGKVPEEKTIQALSQKFRVSKLAIYTRLRTLNYITSSDYSEIYDERQSISVSNISGGNYYTNVINNSGKRFSEELYSAQSQGKITTSDISRVLGVSMKNINKLREVLMAGRSIHG